jgi:hypothetical protein
MKLQIKHKIKFHPTYRNHHKIYQIEYSLLENARIKGRQFLWNISEKWDKLKQIMTDDERKLEESYSGMIHWAHELFDHKKRYCKNNTLFMQEMK